MACMLLFVMKTNGIALTIFNLRWMFSNQWLPMLIEAGFRVLSWTSTCSVRAFQSNSSNTEDSEAITSTERDLDPIHKTLKFSESESCYQGSRIYPYDTACWSVELLYHFLSKCEDQTSPALGTRSHHGYSWLPCAQRSSKSASHTTPVKCFHHRIPTATIVAYLSLVWHTIRDSTNIGALNTNNNVLGASVVQGFFCKRQVSRDAYT